jgi:hypothetical protein
MGKVNGADGGKRLREGQHETDEQEQQEDERMAGRRRKQRTETLEKKKIHKEVYKKSADRKKIVGSNKQWSC